jgi:hypothetical protein
VEIDPHVECDRGSTDPAMTGLHEEFKRRIKTQTVLPPALVEGDGAAM